MVTRRCAAGCTNPRGFTTAVQRGVSGGPRGPTGASYVGLGIRASREPVLAGAIKSNEVAFESIMVQVHG